METKLLEDMVHSWCLLWPGCNVAIRLLVVITGAKHPREETSRTASTHSCGKLYARIILTVSFLNTVCFSLKQKSIYYFS